MSIKEIISSYDTIDVIKLTHLMGAGRPTYNVSAIMEEFPESGRAGKISKVFYSTGGPAASASVALSRLGANTIMLGVTGDDMEGGFVHNSLNTEGVNTDFLYSQPNTRSRVILSLVDAASGERSYSFCPDTCSASMISDKTTNLVKGAGALFLDEADSDGLLLAKIAYEARVPVFFSGGWLSPSLDILWNYLTVAVISLEFASQWRPDHTTEQVLHEIAGFGVELVVLTQGAKGSTALYSGEFQHCLSIPTSVVDTTGAGDAFFAGMIFSTLQGWSVPNRLTFASAMASLNCQSFGGISGLPTLSEVKGLLTIHST